MRTPDVNHRTLIIIYRIFQQPDLIPFHCDLSTFDGDNVGSCINRIADYSDYLLSRDFSFAISFDNVISSDLETIFV